MSASPWATAVTRPVDETVATPGADDCHVACCVTSDVVPVLCVAVATSCRVCPASIVPDASPLARTWTALVVGVGARGRRRGTVGAAGHDGETQRHEHEVQDGRRRGRLTWWVQHSKLNGCATTDDHVSARHGRQADP